MGDDRRAPTDAELAGAWQAGDAAAGTRLLRRYVRPLDRYFRTKLGAAEAEDLRQETLIRVSRAIAEFRFRSSVRTYVYRIAYLTLCDRLRYRQTGRGRRDAGQCSLEQLDGIAALDASLDADASDLVRALRMLAIDDQVLIELICVEGLRYAEVAEVLELDCALSTLRARVHGIKRQLRALLGERDENLRHASGRTRAMPASFDLRLRQLRVTLDRPGAGTQAVAIR